MREEEHHIGERLSLKGQLCTVRYLGPVADKPGVWLGVEWDDRDRGKHNGTHEGVTYFTCRSQSPKAASFLRPAQSWDPPRNFLQALREKYMPEFHEDDAETVYFSGKQAEGVGFEKFHRRQAKLHGIHVLVLDRMRIQNRSQGPNGEHETSTIRQLCADITELDLSGNLFETLGEILELCRHLSSLRVLTLDTNRFTVDLGGSYPRLSAVKSLSLSRTLLDHSEVNDMLADVFPSVEALVFADNEVKNAVELKLTASILSLDLSDNGFVSVASVGGLLSANHLRTLLLKRNRISSVFEDETANFMLSIVELDLSYNAIDRWSFFTDITSNTFPNLMHLRVTGNPLYQGLISAEGKPLTTEDGYTLTIARLPQLEYLNYSKITDKERLNAETYYLGQIAVEISNATQTKQAQVIARHPRYKALCEEYGTPEIQGQLRRDQADPNSMTARLVTVSFVLAPQSFPRTNQRTWIEEIPKSFNIYSILGLVSKRLGIQPLDLRLVLETDERDPLGQERVYAGPEWWDSSDDEVEDANGHAGEWIKREVELVAGTRALGTYVESNEANVRIEIYNDDC